MCITLKTNPLSMSTLANVVLVPIHDDIKGFVVSFPFVQDFIIPERYVIIGSDVAH